MIRLLIDILFRSHFYFYCLTFRLSYIGFTKNNCNSDIVKNIACLMHSFISSYFSLLTCIWMEDDTYKNMVAFTSAYLITDTLIMIENYKTRPKLGLIGHHLIALSVFFLPKTRHITIALFLAEFSNIANNYTYVLIKSKSNPFGLQDTWSSENQSSVIFVIFWDSISKI